MLACRIEVQPFFDLRRIISNKYCGSLSSVAPRGTNCVHFRVAHLVIRSAFLESGMKTSSARLNHGQDMKVHLSSIVWIEALCCHRRIEQGLAKNLRRRAFGGVKPIDASFLEHSLAVRELEAIVCEWLSRVYCPNVRGERTLFRIWTQVSTPKTGA